MDFFERNYLICLDYGDDINYVVGRHSELEMAKSLADKARRQWPGRDVYITVEKVPRGAPLVQDNLSELGLDFEYSQNPTCTCGKTSGACIGQLSCRCNALALCKRVEEEINPMDYEKHHGFKKPPLQETDIEVISIRRVVQVRIPAWDDGPFGLPLSDFEPYIRTQLREGMHLRARVNLDAERVEDLIIEDIRI